ncbi:M23 family metallopeptidase [Natronolimnohabitans innermongolicus]|uniref:Peptidase M23 n=1 Tax=Natronolimnohabitans innermongolicus JCM 12255 TaxID=1227499 RepID=L9XAU8_9EURY|nr:M23 family metallopeptidase [Natronolimnohabitans innermongolicus]ELY58767.1 Peptidase M23 [Natronolimnohabitans innermongolicus JCM 12255]
MSGADESAATNAIDDTESRSEESVAARVRRRLRELDPVKYGWLGLLAVPGHLVDSLAFMQLFGLFFFLFFWIFLEPLVDLALKRGADEETEPTDWIHMGDWREWAVAYLSIPLTFLNPLVLAQDGLQLLGSGVASVRHRGSVPDPTDDRPIDYRLPVDGTWTVVNGSLEKEYSHSWLPLTQRYAYDFVITDDDGRTRPVDTGPAVEDYYCYDEPVLAPADGVVVDVLDTDLEPSRGGGFAHPLKRDIPGNYVTIQHAPDEYSCLAHLVPGSVAVEPGERVERGQRVGRCGHTGNSSEPHLHFQVQDHPVFGLAAGIPLRFANVEVESPWLDGERASEDATTPATETTDDGAGGDERERTVDDGGPTAITAGQRVTTAEQPARAAAESPTRAADGAGPARSRKSARASPRPRALATLERLALGGVVAGVLAVLATVATGIAGVPVAPLAVALVLAAAAGVGFGWRFVVGGPDRVSRPGWPGAPLGIGLVAALWATVPAARSPVVLVGLGVAAYVLFGEYDRYALRRAFDRGPEPEAGSASDRSVRS